MHATTKTVTYTHAVLEGSAYEVGKMQGEAVRAIPPAAEFFRSGAGKFSQQEFSGIRSLFDIHCPGLNEEINGFAEGLGCTPEDVVFYAQTYLKAGQCSHCAVLPSQTQDGHLLIGRNYDFGDTMDDLRLCTTRIQGNAAHIGFSCMDFGRLDGMNEHGLAVTMSASGLPVGLAPGMTPPVQDGLHFWALIRAILDRCHTIDEALQIVAAMPQCSNFNLLIAEQRGTAAVVEVSGPHYAVKWLDASSEEQFVAVTNHFTIAEMQPHVPSVLANSFVRADTIQAHLRQAAPQIRKATLRELLSTPYPDGLCTHHFSDFFGTLWSLIFDPVEGTVDITLGPSSSNPWHTFDLQTPAGVTIYQATLPLQQAEPSFWEFTSLV